MTKLYSISKKPLAIIFSSTCFKKHQDFLFEQPSREEKPTLFFYLPSTTNSSHVINQVRENVSLHPIDCPYIDCLMKLSNNIQNQRRVCALTLRDLEKCENAAETIWRFLKDAVEVSNSNIVRNVNNLLTDLTHNNNKNITWVGTMKQRVDYDKVDNETLWLLVTYLIVICSYLSTYGMIVLGTT